MYRNVLTIMAFVVTTLTAGEYTLDVLVDEAAKNSKQVQSVQKEIEKTVSQVKEAKGSALPKIKGSANYSHGEGYKPSASTDRTAMNEAIKADYKMFTGGITDSSLREHIQLAGPIMTGVTLKQMQDMLSGLMSAKKNTVALSLSLEQPVYAQGKVKIGLKIAEAYQNTLQFKLADEQLKVKGAITKSFYAALLAQNGVTIQEEATKLAEETHRLAVIQLAVGKGSELDTLLTRLRLENSRIDVQKAKSDLHLSYEVIITQTGIEDSPNQFKVSGGFPEIVFDVSIDSALAKVTENNNQLKMLEGTKLVQDQLVNLAKSDFYPLVFAGASLSKIGQYNTFDELKSLEMGNDWKVFAGLSMDLFTGFRRNQKLYQARTDNQLFILTKEQAEDGLQLATKSAYEQVVNSLDRLGATQSVMVLAEKGHSIAKRAYEVGSKTMLDVQSAEFELNRAKIALSAAKFSVCSALVDLKLLMGDL